MILLSGIISSGVHVFAFPVFLCLVLSFSGAKAWGFGLTLYDELHWAEGKYQAFWRDGKLDDSTEQDLKRFVGFEFLFCFHVYSCFLSDFSTQLFFSGLEFQVATVISLSHSLACVSIVTNPDIISLYMPALRAAVMLRHSCWDWGRNRSRGWELDAALRGHSLITPWGLIPPIFGSFFPPPPLLTGSES